MNLSKQTMHNKIRSRKKISDTDKKKLLILVDLKKRNAKITEIEGKVPSICV